MPYEKTPPKWVAVRMAVFAVWPGLPVYGLMEWLTSLKTLYCVSIAVVVVVILDVLVEQMRKQSGSDGS